MKKSIQILFSAVIAISMFNSCSKDSEDATPEYSEKNTVVVLTYGGDYENYEEVISLQTIGKNSSSLKIDGIEWTETIRPEKLAAQFKYTGEVTQSRILRTDKPIASCTLVTGYLPKDSTKEDEGMTVNVQYYIEGDLVKTDNYSTNDQEESYQGNITIQDYID